MSHRQRSECHHPFAAVQGSYSHKIDIALTFFRILLIPLIQIHQSIVEEYCYFAIAATRTMKWVLFELLVTELPELVQAMTPVKGVVQFINLTEPLLHLEIV